MINSTKFYVSVFTLSKSNNIEFLENLKQGFKRTIYWNKYRSEVTKQPKSNNLDYVTNPIFKNINRLFVLLFRVSENVCTRNYFLNK